MTVTSAAPRPRSWPALLALLLPTACLAWAFWPTLVELVQTWNGNPQYSHGYLVPVFAVVLLWLRRKRLDAAALRPSVWGLGVLAAGLALRLGGAFFYLNWLEQLALPPCLAGLCVLVGGRAAWRWAWPSLLFLYFMIPLPFSLEHLLSGPLQWLATLSSAFVMQLFGLPALADGNVILLNDHQIDVVEACSGLRMLIVFFALATAFIFVVRRPWPDKALLLASAIPIALVSNIARITLTGVLFETGVQSETVHAFFHDAAGWLMMPFALLLLWAELRLLSLLLIKPPPLPPRSVRAPAARRTPAAPRPAPGFRKLQSPAAKPIGRAQAPSRKAEADPAGAASAVSRPPSR